MVVFLYEFSFARLEKKILNLRMVFDIASVFSCDWNWKFSVAMLPLILLTLAPVTEAKNDFSVYRMNQYDIIKEPYGSRSGLVSFEGKKSSFLNLKK